MRNPAQDRLLSREEIRKLKNAGYDIHDLKGGKRAAQYDLENQKIENRGQTRIFSPFVKGWSFRI
jgi:hypothetical protein